MPPIEEVFSTDSVLFCFMACYMICILTPDIFRSEFPIWYLWSSTESVSVSVEKVFGTECREDTAYGRSVRSTVGPYRVPVPKVPFRYQKPRLCTVTVPKYCVCVRSEFKLTGGSVSFSSDLYHCFNITIFYLNISEPGPGITMTANEAEFFCSFVPGTGILHL